MGDGAIKLWQQNPTDLNLYFDISKRNVVQIL